MLPTSRRLYEISGGSDGDPASLAAARLREEAEREGTTPPAQFVPAEDFKKLEAQFGELREMFKTTMEGVRAVVADRQAKGEPPPPSIVEPTDEELEQAILEGKGAAAKITARVNAGMLRMEQAIKQLREEGLVSIGEMAKAQATTKLPYYEKYKSEIEGYVGKLSPELRANPQIYKVAHDTVVGAHIEEIRTEEREKALRSSREGEPPGEPSGQTSRSTGGKGKTPTVEELFGSDAAEALRMKGQTPDAFAQRLGHKNWAAYVELHEKQMAEA